MQFESNYASELFDQFLSANTMRTVITHFKRICNFLDIEPTNFDTFYPQLKKGIVSWKAQSIFNKLDKKASNKIYLFNQKHEILKGQKCLIIGGGPCGLRTAIELQLLGSDHVMIVEKRDRVSRNNVIHLWPFVIHDLKELAGKKLNPKFCPSAIDHVSIRNLQLMLLKIALILGCDYVDNVAFEQICPLSIQQPVTNVTTNKQTNTEQCCCKSHKFDQINNQQIGAFAHFKYNAASNYPCIIEKLETYAFNILIGADGRRNLLSDYFPRKEFRGRLAIAITCNFINNHTLAEAQVPEISGISFIYYQQLFKSLYEQTNIDLENICYYKDDTHYFVMTAKKASLLSRGVLKEDFQDTRALLSPENIDQNELLTYAKDAARWTTGLDNLKFALNHYGIEDVAMFDFTSMYAAENACRVKEIYLRTNCCNKPNNNVKNGLLLTALVGDSLLEPFWPTGSGCGRGFLSSMDAAWFCREFSIRCLMNGNSHKSIKENEENILSVISERESIYRLLAQTKSENLNQNFSQYTINPVTRYPNLNSLTIMPNQCKHLLYSNVRKAIHNRQTLAEKRARRITIACTPDTFKQQFLKPQVEEEIEEGSIGNNQIIINKEPVSTNDFKLTGKDYLANNKQYMTPSAFNLASIEKSRNKEIESVIKHRKQREERLTQESISSEERFMNHIRKQIKPKADWFLNAKTENSYESNTSSNRSNNSSQEDLRDSQFLNHFSSKVRDLEFKLNSHNTFNEEKYLKNQNSNKNEDGGNMMIAKLTLQLQDLLDPIKQEAKFKEEVKRKAFLEKDYKFVGKLTKEDWNVKLFNGDKDEDNLNKQQSIKSTSSKPRPKERIAIFKEKLHNIENILTNGKSKTDDEVNLLIKKQLQKFEVRNGRQCGEWIEKLKSELSDKQQSNAYKKFNSKPLVRKRSVDNDNQESSDLDAKSSVDNYLIKRNPNIQYIKYEKINNPTIQMVKQQNSNDSSKYHSLDRLKMDKKIDNFIMLETSKISYAKDNCAKCKHKVLTVDKLNINGILFHRNCLKCNNCGANLRLSELRQIDLNIIDVKNCICTMCSNETRLIRSNSTSNYSNALKERIKWKEIFLLNLDCQNEQSNKMQQDNKNEIDERVEYENNSFKGEYLDDEEVTKLLNLDNKDVCCSKSSQSSDILADENNEEEEDEMITSNSTSETTSSSTDTTGADINSDQFDLSEFDSPKNKNNKQNLPEIVVDEEENLNDNFSDDEHTLNDNNSNNGISNNYNISNNGTSNNNTSDSTLNNPSNNNLNNSKSNSILNNCSIPEKSKTISDISEVDEFDDLTDKTVDILKDKKINNQNLELQTNHQKPSSFKVELPKLFSNNQERYSKIPVLNDRIQNEIPSSLNSKKPVYGGSFTEKIQLKSRSIPSLNGSSNLSSFTNYYQTSFENRFKKSTKEIYIYINKKTSLY